MKELNVPFLSDLEGISIRSAAELLEEYGTKKFVESLNWIKEYPYKPITLFYVAHSSSHFYIKFNVHGSMLKAVYDVDQSPVNEDSCVQFYAKLPNENYYNCFEFNCIGTCKAYQKMESSDKIREFSLDDLQKIQRCSSLGRRVFNEMEGMFEWDLTVSIPLSLMGINIKEFPLTILGNFNKCADKTDSQHYVTWNPVKTEKPDFHRPDFFGEIILE